MNTISNNNKQFDIPIVLFTFKRYKTVLRILKRIEPLRPQKLYIISDGPRTEEEKIEIDKARKIIEEGITWNCEIIRDYAEENVGIYNRIGLGAKWVLSKEEHAIFLEDDNLPEETFFPFCKEMLERYKNDSRVLWICGTNYLEKYQPQDGSSYVFTKHLLPCGWASWKGKFESYYDGELQLLTDKDIVKRVKDEYTNVSLYHQQINSASTELYRKEKNQRFSSWDFQMAFSIRAHNVLGISPCYNQIKNIGVDNLSTHGGTSFSNIMTRRFCGIESFPLAFPLKHPKTVLTDLEYEKKVDKIILFPKRIRIKSTIARFIKRICGINKYEKFKSKSTELR
ncbi:MULTISPECIES: glycosyltransferase family 2 protein [Psychrilyobacter]|uniref:Glycosyltransferase family 2 protein n=1 Tax=Psychrilyobacter piezotolerans TaxID=2293438 RepID=A0ABX9KEF6_9FUSO|nr:MULTISPECIES: glycosyltransferase family 2 protein [Psychrilyobacter]MCS5422123.1 hypothetical protein [Psychrilyobacter sp. S5]NDI76280.1 glycosyltransferase family 2 protein [Psychrilyobacter piezotolerans]RDE59165.1 glycosyltransferase family 2 protein [Psychrilyobacter sp. S5]REI39727.1 glycosyltransferase family 2 protein [Psychrilyobacter piezotolerans]